MSKKSTPDRIAGPDIQRAIEHVVEYLAADEWEHFDGEPDHIWRSVRILRDWLGWEVFWNEGAETAAREKHYRAREKDAERAEQTKISEPPTAA
jgi:hypothetical protein